MSHFICYPEKHMFCVHLRNEYDLWKVHGIVNTLGLLQSK